MPYKVFKPNNPGCNAIKQEIRVKLNELIDGGQIERIERIYRKAFDVADGDTMPTPGEMVVRIVDSVQSQSPELRDEVRKPN
jgi:hypothetical protein